MTKVKKNIYGVLRGSFLTDEKASKNWKILVFVVLLLLIMISSSHRADEKVLLISELNKEKRELRAEYVDTKTALAKMKLESTVRKRVKHKGLAPAKIPPQKIKVIIKKE